jgi:hypothetical protein
VRRVLQNEDAIILSGGAIQSIEQFWSTIADELGLYTDFEASSESAESNSRTLRGEAGISIVKGSREGTSEVSQSSGDRRGRTRPVAAAARTGLLSSQRILVIDDFHYIPQDVQIEIVRGLKDLVFEGVAVIVIAVPHRAYDVVRVEKEMTGRVQQLSVGFWSDEELIGIGNAGFKALNLTDHKFALTNRLVRESFASPHLMQDFCLNLCKQNGVRESSSRPHALKAPEWDDFFRGRASLTSRTAFDFLARGPRQRTDRKERILKDGTVTDIYGAILAGIAETGPLTSLTYESLRAALREVMQSEAPQKHEVTRVLEEMSKIAREQIEGEPVVDYDDAMAMLHISDPYFAYYLRWGDRLAK